MQPPRAIATKFMLALVSIAIMITHSESSDAQACSAGTTIYFANGVNTSYSGALLNMYRVRKAFTDAAPPQTDIQYDIAYNPTGGLRVDLAETAAMLSLSVSELQKIYSGAKSPPAALIGWLAAQKASDATTRPANFEGISAQHFALYLNSIRSGRRVMVVAHSQGTLFALRAVALFAAQEPTRAAYFQTLLVATPAPLPLPTPYVTSTLDRVIALVPNAAPPTTENNFVEEDITGHGFRESYLPEIAFGGTRQAIAGYFFDYAFNAPFPTDCTEQRTVAVEFERPFERYQGGLNGAFRPAGDGEYVGDQFSLSVPRFDSSWGELVSTEVGFELDVNGIAQCPRAVDFPPADTCVSALQLRDFVVGSPDIRELMSSLLCDKKPNSNILSCGYPFTADYGIYFDQWPEGSFTISRSFVDAKRNSLPYTTGLVRYPGDPPTWKMDGQFTLRLLTSLGDTDQPGGFYNTDPMLTSFEGTVKFRFSIRYIYVPFTN